MSETVLSPVALYRLEKARAAKRGAWVLTERRRNRAADLKRQREQDRRRQGRVKPVAAHGTRYRYGQGCRCAACVAENRADARRRYQSRGSTQASAQRRAS